MFWDYFFLYFEAIFLCPIITLLPLHSNPLKLSTPSCFSISLLNANYIVSVFRSVNSTSLMIFCFYHLSYISLQWLKASCYFYCRSLYFLSFYKTTKFLNNNKKKKKKMKVWANFRRAVFCSMLCFLWNTAYYMLPSVLKLNINNIGLFYISGKMGSACIKKGRVHF